MTKTVATRKNGWFRTLCGAALFLSVMGVAGTEEAPIVMLIQPLPSDERATNDYQPLARYVGAQIGRQVRIETPSTFPAYWNVLQRNRYDLALDGPHFTDYRAQKFGFVPLVKVPDNASYSLVTRSTETGRDGTQLVGRRIATLGMLSTGAARLNAIFPNPVRQPALVDVSGTAEGIALLLDRRVEAAFLPTAAVNAHPERARLRAMLVTEPVTRLLLSASPRMPEESREKIRKALLRASDTHQGKEMLEDIGLERFEIVLPENFANQRHALRSYWGY